MTRLRRVAFGIQVTSVPLHRPIPEFVPMGAESASILRDTDNLADLCSMAPAPLARRSTGGRYAAKHRV